jgi:hypothetical protein
MGAREIDDHVTDTHALWKVPDVGRTGGDFNWVLAFLCVLAVLDGLISSIGQFSASCTVHSVRPQAV